jgi:hypothetical protein
VAQPYDLARMELGGLHSVLERQTLRCYATSQRLTLNLVERYRKQHKMRLPVHRLLPLFALTVPGASAGLDTGALTLDGNVIVYQAHSGTDPAAFAAFLMGAPLVDFGTVSFVKPLVASSYTGSPTTPANLADPTIAIHGALFPAGGQTPENPANAGAPPVLVDVSGLNGAHSANRLDFTGFFSVNFPLLQPISRFGWWTTPNGVSTGITFPANPGDFVAFAFSSSVLHEVELFQGGPRTIDDFGYARDNALPIGASSIVSEPAPWTLVAFGCACIVILRRALAGPSSR